LTAARWWIATAALCWPLIGCEQEAPRGPPAALREGPPAPASQPAPAPTSAPIDPFAHLYDVEEALRRTIAAGQRPPGPGGADPEGIAVLDDGRALVALRATGELLLLDKEARERGRVPSAAGALDVATLGRQVFVVGDADRHLVRHTLEGDALGGAVALLDDLAAPSAVTVVTVEDQACVVVADDPRGALVVVPAEGRAASGRVHVGPRLIGVDAFGDLVVARSLVDHTAVVFRADARCALTELGRITRDGPIAAASAFTTADGDVHVVVAGVEDRPLDRSDGFFGDLDTVVARYRLDGRRGGRVWSTNVGALGLVNVKALVLEGPARAPATVLALSAGSDAAARLAVADGTPGAPTRLSPTSAAAAKGAWLWRTSSLTDTVTLHRRSDLDAPPARTATPAGGPAREPLVALGEALAFTSLMSQQPKAEGQHSVVSCESCHHRLSVDGRTHFTGRRQGGDRVVATTRTLFGLLQARPHFSRALDKTSTKMVDNEFGVMAAGTEAAARFTLFVADHPWLAQLGLPADDALDPAQQREALMRFLASARPPPSPAARDRRGAAAAFTPLEAKGADAFATRCSRCHAPRVLLDDETTATGRSRWAAHLLGDAPSLVWARDGYEKTGVTPYVHDEGARPSPLFALWLKRPLLTTGEAKTLEQLLGSVRDRPEGFLHRPPTDDDGSGKLPVDEREALAAFLRLF
jgi:hypothetical protein